MQNKVWCAAMASLTLQGVLGAGAAQRRSIRRTMDTSRSFESLSSLQSFTQCKVLFPGSCSPSEMHQQGPPVRLQKCISRGQEERCAWCCQQAYWSHVPQGHPAVHKKNARRMITRATSKLRDNVPQPESMPLWLWILISIQRVAREALEFLREQPGQLKYIEWPSLHSTAKMAVLTVIVVVFLIIFLATIDSTFSFLLSSILRRAR